MSSGNNTTIIIQIFNDFIISNIATVQNTPTPKITRSEGVKNPKINCDFLVFAGIK